VNSVEFIQYNSQELCEVLYAHLDGTGMVSDKAIELAAKIGSGEYPYDNLPDIKYL
jgi:hypothetical protein